MAGVQNAQITQDFRSGYYGFRAIPATIPPPGPYTVSLAGHEYLVDTSFEMYRRDAFRHRSVPPQRQSINYTNIGGEATVNTEGLWRREQTRWSEGAGQLHLDRKQESSELRFLSSKGVDVWTEWQMSLLKDTTARYTTGNANVLTAQSNKYTYVVDGTTVKWYNSSWALQGTVLYNSMASSTTTTTVDATATTIAVTSTANAAKRGQITVSDGTNSLTFAHTGKTATSFTGCTLVSGGPYAAAIGASSAVVNNGAGSSPARVNGITSSGTHIFLATDTGLWQISSDVDPGVANLYVAVGKIQSSQVLMTGVTGATKTHYLLNPNGFPGVSVHARVTDSDNHIKSENKVKVTNVGSTSIKISKPLTGAVTGTDVISFAHTAGQSVTEFTDVVYANSCVVAFGISNISTTANLLFAWTTDPAALGDQPDASDLLMAHPDQNWTWTSATGGLTQLYFGGYSTNGNVTTGGVYRSSFQGPSNSGVLQPYSLNYPVLCLPIEAGEAVYSVYGYLNFIFVGTNLGIRMCQTLNAYDPSATSSGDLKSGPVFPSLAQPVTEPVTSMVGNGRFVYFSWNNYDTNSTGLGRIDVSTFVGGTELQPAYASDLMITGQGSISSLGWDAISDSPLMSLPGKGVYTGASTYVSSGNINTGYITYGIPDPKVAVYASMEGTFNGGSADISLSADHAAPYAVAHQSDSSNVDYDAGTLRAERFQMITTINAPAGQANTPIMRRTTLKSYPAIASEANLTIPILMFRYSNVNGQEFYVDPYAEYYYLDQLRRDQTLVQYIEGGFHANVIIDVLDWLPDRRQDVYTGGYEGYLIATVKTVGGFQYQPPHTS